MTLYRGGSDVSNATGGIANTAQELLDKIKTVDGEGSGLDADLLKGNAPTATGIAYLTGSTGFVEDSHVASDSKLNNRITDAKSVFDIIPDSEHAGIIARTSTYDCTSAIQEALDSGELYVLPLGRYRVTGELVVSSGSKLIGMGTWSGVASTQKGNGTSHIWYDGAGGANTCVVRMSDAAVGTDPANGSTRDIQNVTFTNMLIDGGEKAEIGVYCVRAWSNNNIDFLTVTGTLKHGFWAGKCWNGSPRNWMAYKNIGSGVTLGRDTFGWGSAPVDQSVCNSFFAYFSGHDSNTTAQNAFDDSTAEDSEYGIGVFGGRGLVMLNAQAAKCGGAGIYASPTFYPITFVGGYCEGNGVSTGATRDWDIWINSATNSWNLEFDGMHLGLTPAIKLKGSAPSRVEHGVIFRRMALLGTIDSGWSNYRLIDCDRNVTIVGTSPHWFREARHAARNLDAAGRAVFDASSGAISLLMSEGIIDTITYTAVGTYTVTLKETFSSARYSIQLTGGDNRAVGVGSVTTNSFIIYNRGGGTLTDGNSRISVEVTGYYT